MYKALISDFSRVILHPIDTSYTGSLNGIHRALMQKLAYNPLVHFILNVDLLNFYNSLKPKLDLYIFTSENIQDAPQFAPYLSPIFKSVFSASKLGVTKTDTQAYLSICKSLNLEPSQVIYIDDSVANTEAAASAGLKTVIYKNNQTTIQEIKNTLQI